MEKNIKKSTPTTKPTTKKLPWSSLAITVVLSLLVFLSLAQAVQAAFLLRRINSAGISAPATSAPSLEEMPDMVGDC